MDSFFGDSFPVWSDGLNASRVTARITPTISVPMIVFFCIAGQVTFIGRVLAVKCYIKDKKPFSGRKEMLTECRFLPMKCLNRKVKPLKAGEKIQYSSILPGWLRINSSQISPAIGLLIGPWLKTFRRFAAQNSIYESKFCSAHRQRSGRS